MTAESGTVERLLGDLIVFRVHELPRNPGSAERTAPADSAAVPRPQATAHADRARRLAALASAYHADGGTFALGWRRLAAAGRVDIFVGGEALAGSADGDTILSLPAGGRGHRQAPGALASAMARLPSWCPIVGIVDGLLSDPDDLARRGRAGVGAGAGSARPSLEDGLLAVWREPFAWLLLAEPVRDADGSELVDEVADQLRIAQTKEQTSPEYAVRARRLRMRHRELARGTATGLWRVRLLAGGASPEAARRVAALVCASADLEGLPYALSPAPGTAALGTLMDAPVTAPRGGSFPLVADSELVAALACTPGREVPGVRCVMRPEFDVTPETATVPAHPPGHAGPDSPDSDPPGAEVPGLSLGRILDGGQVVSGGLALPRASLNRHSFVCGATGSGKSQTVRALLEEATVHGIPWMVVEPVKAEYRLMAARLAGAYDVVRIRPGDVDALPAGINPLEPAAGPGGERFPLQSHVALVRELFLAAFMADDPFPQVLSAALTSTYEDLGWDLALGEPAVPGTQPRYPTLADLQDAADRVVSRIGYGREVADNVRGFVRVRLASLRLGATGRFFEGGHPLDFARLLNHNVVLEIEDIGDDMDKAFLMGTVLIRLVEHLRLRQHAHGGAVLALRHLTVIEEAHRLLRRAVTTGAAAHAVEMFAGMLAEIRAYGEGLVVVEQIPSKLIEDVLKNTAVKVVHRLPAADDRAAVGATMNLTAEQSQHLVSLPSGDAAVFTDGMDFPLLVRMPDGTRREGDNPARTACPARLVTPRSATCGPRCQAEPCTLRDMRNAQRTLDHAPVLRLWAELAVLAHLTGWPMPVAHPLVREEIESLGTRLRDCTMSHAVDAAVTARSMAISERVGPEPLALHVTRAISDRLDDGGRCPREEPQWLAPAYRWSLVRDALRIRLRENPAAPRHTKTETWESSYGHPLPGATSAQQLAVVQQWYEADQRDGSRLRAVIFGQSAQGSTSAIERAVGSTLEDPAWPERLAEGLAPFGECRWAYRLLAPRDGQRKTGKGGMKDGS
jgi:uncharacterized protein